MHSSLYVDEKNAEIYNRQYNTVCRICLANFIK